MLLRRSGLMAIALFAALAFASVPACTSLSGAASPEVEATTTAAVQSTCASAKAALRVLTVANEQGKITPAKKSAISTAGHALLPVCGARAPPTVSSVEMAAFEAAAGLLIRQAGGVP